MLGFLCSFFTRVVFPLFIIRRLFFRPDDSELDEFHPKASRTLFVGNLLTAAAGAAAAAAGGAATQTTTALAEQLRERFSPFGDILDVDVKRSAGHALVQFSDVASAAKAIRRLDGEPLSTATSSSTSSAASTPSPAMRLAFARMVPSKCVWCRGLSDGVTESVLRAEFGRFGKMQDVLVDSQRGHALIYFDQVSRERERERERERKFFF